MAGCLCFTVPVTDKAFEEEFKQLPEATILEEPQKLATSSVVQVFIETDQGDFIRNIKGEDDYPLLKLEKGDRVKYLDSKNRVLLEIITLRGKPYQKKIIR